MPKNGWRFTAAAAALMGMMACNDVKLPPAPQTPTVKVFVQDEQGRPFENVLNLHLVLHDASHGSNINYVDANLGFVRSGELSFVWPDELSEYDVLFVEVRPAAVWSLCGPIKGRTLPGSSDRIALSRSNPVLHITAKCLPVEQTSAIPVP